MAKAEKTRAAATANIGKPLDNAASTVLEQLLSQLRTSLLAQADNLSDGDYIGEDELYVAYKRLGLPDKDSLAFADAQTVISHALRENRVLGWISCGMALLLLVFGLVLLGIGVGSADATTRIGGLCGGSIGPCLRA